MDYLNPSQHPPPDYPTFWKYEESASYICSLQNVGGKAGTMAEAFAECQQKQPFSKAFFCPRDCSGHQAVVRAVPHDCNISTYLLTTQALPPPPPPRHSSHLPCGPTGSKWKVEQDKGGRCHHRITSTVTPEDQV